MYIDMHVISMESGSDLLIKISKNWEVMARQNKTNNSSFPIKVLIRRSRTSQFSDVFSE